MHFLRMLILLALVAVAARADEPGIRLGEATTSQWRFGVTIRAVGGPASGIRATLPVPMDWPEQQVKIIREEKSPGVGSVTYATLDGGVKQMQVNIPRLAAGGEASANLTLEITKRQILAPDETSGYAIPARPGQLSKYLGKSPYIESTDPKIRSLAAELTAGKAGGWDQAAAVFDWVRANVKYEFAEQIKPAVAALNDGKGDCEELSSLVIALCRASKIPSRAVWVPGHCYPEFALIDGKGQTHWFPCQAAGGDRQFGSMVEDRPILQKGDNFRVPGQREPQRYVQQTLSAKDAAAPPEYKFIMERVEQ
jgi:transglutaminase-like putative cysteine protease